MLHLHRNCCGLLYHTHQNLKRTTECSVSASCISHNRTLTFAWSDFTTVYVICDLLWRNREEVASDIVLVSDSTNQQCMLQMHSYVQTLNDSQVLIDIENNEMNSPWISIWKWHISVFPYWSTVEHVISVVPIPKLLPDILVQVIVGTIPELSVAVAGSHVSMLVVWPTGSVMLRFEGQDENTGNSSSKKRIS